ncbi:flavin monoamine oxidase family protein [Algisphaera agarilytica]|uniref:Tryptophan 2-monooxygenase n=1 Tax=Algisphaera agarilytica TaxID=1385975 RepID=A0A7X0H6J0_9BACT|nr:FAD-dependent oxidoreductase [Algisphaera agarilytica]MBB6430190.1 monoamine oxidase [Algisphaera agarilytica]
MFDSPNTPLGRRRFIAQGMAGLASLLVGCNSRSSKVAAERLGERIVIVGAGPAGMTAAHLLRQYGVEVAVFEAAPTHGGRIKHHTTFTDFPISLGAEWVHVGPGILDEIVNDPAVNVTTKVRAYDPNDLAGYYDGRLMLGPIGDELDRKFVGSSWLDFFNTYIYPGIADAITFDSQVTAIDYAGDTVQLTDAKGATHVADRVIVTVPLKILQRGDLAFTPALPPRRARAIASADIWSGLKVFLEFTEKFYPAALAFPDSEMKQGQRLYYDAAYGQKSQANILGLFAVGHHAESYLVLSEDELLKRILAELDEVFEGEVSRTYVRHLVQNWNDEPYIHAAYLADDAPVSTSQHLAGSVDDRVYFAGDAYTRFHDWSSVHAAAWSAMETVEDLLS